MKFNLFNSILCFLLFIKNYSIHAQCKFNPNTNEGYMQIWNFEHHSSQYFLFLTFMISNQGKGDLNNGLTIYFFDKLKNKEYLKTLEFTNKHLKAIPDDLQIELENHSKLKLTSNKILIDANSGEDKPIFKLKIEIPLNINDKNTTIDSYLDIKNNTISYKIIYFLPQRIKFRFKENHYQSFGAIGMECLHTKDNPLDIANSFYFIRNFDIKHKFFLFYLDNENQKHNGYIHYYNTSFPILNEYKITINNKFFLESDQCKISSKELKYIGGFYVLNNVSMILRWFLKLIGIDPFIKHYRSSLYLNCKNKINYFPMVQFTHIQLKQ
ncbi:MAG: hypothetical protein KatS3mg129_0723 [Leptospiraceae bacterium]|nr:MAG: hypothetical protein KatS3mg129_0723 [Leptospiraceae bacterium]